MQWQMRLRKSHPDSMQWRRWAEPVVVLGAYAALALLLSWPLPLHFGDSIPGVPGDVWSYLWAMGWARTSALDLGVNPFHTDYVYYPLGGATQLLWATALPSFLSIPLQLAFGLVPAFNLMYIAATVFTAYGTYELAKYILTPHAPRSTLPHPHSAFVWRVACFVSGSAFAFCALRLGYGLAFTNLYHTELIPFYLLFLLKTNHERTRRNPIFAGLLLGLNAYIDFQIAAFLVMVTVLWFIGVAVREHGRVWDRLGRWGAVAVVAALVVAPIITVLLQDFAIEGGNYIRVYPLKYSADRSYDLLSYFLPNARSSLYQVLPAPHVAGVNAALDVEGESQLSPDRQAFFGITLLALAVYGAVRGGRQAWLWIAITALFALLSFGPTLHIAASDTGIPLPYTALHEIPVVSHIRIPMRYGIMVLLGAALLAAFGANCLLERVSRPATALAGGGILSALILAEAAVLPYPTLRFEVPRVYNTIAAQPGDFTVLEIPSFNWRAAAANEAFQAIHHKRLLRAYTNRIAPDLADYFSLRQTPVVIRSLRIVEGEEAAPFGSADIERDRAAAPAVIRFFNLRYAVLHHGWLSTERDVLLDRYLREVLGAQEVFEGDGVTAYEFATEPRVPGPGLSLDLFSDDSLLYLGRGWQTEPLADVEGTRGRFFTGSASEFYFDLANVDSGVLKFRAHAEREKDVLQFELNGRVVGAVGLKVGWNEYSFDLPADALQSGLNKLRWLHNVPEANRIAVSSIQLH